MTVTNGLVQSSTAVSSSGTLASGDAIEVTVSARETAAEGTVILTLIDPEGRDLPPWEPGAHIDLELSNGLVRQYSLCGDPEDRKAYRVGVLLEPAGAGGSKYIHESLVCGQRIKIRGPRNHFKLVKADRYLFIAGGIGITPIITMIKQVEAAGKQWELHYAGRSARTMAFTNDLVEYGPRVSVYAKEAGQRLDLNQVLSAPDISTVVYCCGPESLNDAADSACGANWRPSTLHLERFTAKEIDETGNTAFTIQLAQSGLTLVVPPDKSTMQVMEEAGIKVPCSCAAGTCGTCETYVLEGIPEHRDSVLTDDERADNTSMMVCVSRSKSPLLVLDI